MNNQIRVCIDLDGTICELKQEGQSYADVAVKDGAKEKIDAMKEAGFYIIINTARGMGTAEANEGRMMKRVGEVTLEWLRTHEIYYDEIYFGKPNAHLTIDDRSTRFSTWDEISNELVQKLARAK